MNKIVINLVTPYTKPPPSIWNCVISEFNQTSSEILLEINFYSPVWLDIKDELNMPFNILDNLFIFWTSLSQSNPETILDQPQAVYKATTCPIEERKNKDLLLHRVFKDEFNMPINILRQFVYFLDQFLFHCSALQSTDFYVGPWANGLQDRANRGTTFRSDSGILQSYHIS